MKKIITVLCLLLFAFNHSYGQWYYNRYKVTDINLLTKEQLLESRANTKKDILYSGIAIGVGTAVVMLSINDLWTPKEDPTVIEQIIGKKGMNTIYTGVGIVVVVSGTAYLIGCLDRSHKINKALSVNFPVVESLKLEPAIIKDNFKGLNYPGVALTLRF